MMLLRYFLVLLTVSLSEGAEITLKDNGYNGILVGISECLNETDYPTLLDDIERAFTQFSSSLYLATDYRTYIREVTILIPSSWTPKPHYQPATSESIFDAHFDVQSNDGDHPYATARQHLCEVPWEKVRLPTDYLTSFRPRPMDPTEPGGCVTNCDGVQFGTYRNCSSCTETVICGQGGANPGLCPDGLIWDDFTPGHGGTCKLFSQTCGAAELVHEWGHLRWGLGDETPRDNINWISADLTMCNGHDSNCASTNDVPPKIVMPNRCSHELDFRNPLCSLRDIEDGNQEKCLFEVKPIGPGSLAAGSLMFDMNRDDVAAVRFFCTDDTNHTTGQTHNTAAFNEHNDICDGASAWTVMRRNSDFADDSESPRTLGLATQPIFHVIQTTRAFHRIVLVLDTSGSMSGTRLDTMRQDASLYIQNLPNGTHLGIVQFASSGSSLHDLILVDANRQNLVNALPDQATGGTCIGCGLEKGLEVLKQYHDGKAAGGRLVLISDGINGSGRPTLPDITDVLVENEVTVDTIQYTSAADPAMSAVNEATGGMYFYDDGQVQNTDMVEGLLTILEDTHVPCTSAASATLLTDAQSLVRDVETVIKTTIDGTVGHNTQFSFTFPRNSQQGILDVTLTAPTSGYTYSSSDSKYAVHDTDIGIMYMTIPDEAETGDWSISMTNRVVSSFTSQVVVTSAASSPNVQPITATGSIIGSNIDLGVADALSTTVRVFCQLNQGNLPVLQAEIIATISGPDGDLIVQLLDDGEGMDSMANDGVYTGSFIHFTRNGRHTVSIDVSNDNEKATLGSRNGRSRRDVDAVGEKNIGRFVRTTSAGFFTVTNHPSEGTVPNIHPPGRVSDLRFIRMSEENQTVELTWTAVGDSLFEGIASRYDLRYADSAQRLVDDFDTCQEVDESDVVVGSLLSPKSPGDRELIVFKVDEDSLNTTFVYGLRVFDQGGLKSDTSNRVRVFMPVVAILSDPTTSEEPTTVSSTTPIPPPTPSPPTTTTTAAPTTPNPTTEIENDGVSIGVILAGVCAVILTFLLFGVIVLIIMFRKASKKKSKQPLISETTSVAPSSISKGITNDYVANMYETYPPYQHQMAAPNLPAVLPHHSVPFAQNHIYGPDVRSPYNDVNHMYQEQPANMMYAQPSIIPRVSVSTTPRSNHGSHLGRATHQYRPDNY